MIHLVLIYCLNSNPAACIEKRPAFHGQSPMACMVQAQPIAAEYLKDHPAYMLAGFRCEISNKDEKAT